jgi:tRNA 2-thiouridine synthesizing protein A
MTQAINQTLDTRGLNCPLPILRTKKTIAGMNDGEVLEVIATDPGSLKDIQSFCTQTGHELMDSNQADGEFIFHIRKQ